MFDDRLTKIREEKGLNKKEAAAKLNMPYSTYLSYENNEREPNSETLIQISKFFDVSIDYLLGISSVKSINEDIKQACKTTGLTEKAINALQFFVENEPFGMIYLNELIEELKKHTEENAPLLYEIIEYLHYVKNPTAENTLVLRSNNTIEIIGKKEKKTFNEIKRISEKEIIKRLLLDDIIDTLKA